MLKRDIYIDGSCFGNPGPGGYAAVCRENGKNKVSGGYAVENTTNNQMELMAAIHALNQLSAKGCDITFYTDSRYLITCYDHDQAWLTQDGRKNRELWIQLINTVRRGGHTIRFVKVAGHAGVELNELADKHAKAQCAKARHYLHENS